MRKIYIIGSLRDPKVPEIAASIREDGHDVFDDWFAAGEIADDRWMAYEQTYRKRTLAGALGGRAARHVFEFDKTWLDWADTAVLVLPAGKSAHLELGYMIGKGKKGYVLLDGEPERYDVMYQFADGVYTDLDELRKVLNGPTELEGLLPSHSGGSITQGLVSPSPNWMRYRLAGPQDSSDGIQWSPTHDASLCRCGVPTGERALCSCSPC